MSHAVAEVLDAVDPETPAPGSVSPDPKTASAAPVPLSTDRLVASITSQLSGQPAAVPGPESSPAPTPAAPPTDPNSLDEPHDRSWPKKAIDKVTALRAEKRELKAEYDTKLDTERKHREAAEARLAELEKSPPPNAPAPAAAPDLAALDPEVQRLAQAEREQGQVKQWASEQLRVNRHNPEAVLAVLQKHNVALPDTSPEAVADWLEAFREEAQEKLNGLRVQREVRSSRARESAAEQRQRWSAQARDLIPELKDEQSERFALFRKVQAQYPDTQHTPDGEWAAMVHMLGLERVAELMKARGGKPETKAPAPRPAPAPPLPRLPGPSAEVPLPPGGGGGASSSALFKTYQKTGDPRDKEAWEKALVEGR